MDTPRRAAITRRETLAVTKITPMRDEYKFAPATGFFYRFGKDIALVTNWHVLSGTNPMTGENRGIPNRIQFNINVVFQDGRTQIRAADLPLSVGGSTTWCNTRWRIRKLT